MRNVSILARTGVLKSSTTSVRQVGPPISPTGNVGLTLVLTILFWLIFYQNLPWSLGGFASAGPIQTSNTGDRIIKIGMMLISAYIIMSHVPITRLLLKNINVGMAALMILAPLSAVWSIEPSATLLRYSSLLSIVLTCFAITTAGWHRRRLEQLTIPPLMFIFLSSLAIGFIMPDRIAEIGDDISQRGAWHGITHGKNEFGMFASMGVIICANRFLAREGRMLLALAGTIISGTCLLLSRSNTSLFAAMVGVGSMVLVMRVPVIRDRFSSHVIIAIATTLLVYELVIQKIIPGLTILVAPFASLTGKDLGFSARAIIWNVIKEHISHAPLLGTGYGAYWTGPFPTSPSYVFVTMAFFYPTEAHNGYLEIVDDLGYVGLCCLVVFLIWFVRQGLQLMRFDRCQAALYLALLFDQMVINMSESDWISRTSTFAILQLAVSCLSRALLNAPQLQAAGAAR